ncbi:MULTISPECIES: hypothetical protein [unclassified Actinomyces]|uniref:hypothetical protein n=1 Tax=unclassified Actinomyces TaxID=2609248 RepID=UPI00201781C5|nr:MULTISPECIES: hypothetical protein [unclassified Actinomyces]MCL3777381.1 hypothetical protein [Actinomyces sp. AC-20-1]MCL3789097.1 hypothetical protein [Actinomyces sp. 187325]MCL3791671.1 hypothetical protein [Actinomyces sp. 186855]MCL3793899.1 hypothetical protein [Actinomyces sp. 217892]
MTSLADHVRVGLEPLAFTHRLSTRISALVLGLLLAPGMVWLSTQLILHPDARTGTSRRARLIEGHGLLTQAWGVFCIGLAIWMVYNLISTFRSRVVLTREGIRVTTATGTRLLPWPPSRSAIAVMSKKEGSYASAVWVIAADGSASLVPGTLRTVGAPRRALAREHLRRSLVDADTIWAWALSRGLVRESGQYVDTTNREVKQYRLSPRQEQALREG